MASAAIPLIFPPVEIEQRYYGDGCVRNPAPFSPAIRLGAKKLLIVGVRHGRDPNQPRPELEATEKPTVARILGVIINALMMDTVEYDIDRLMRMNKLVASVPAEFQDQLPLKEIDYLAIQHLIGGLGSQSEASELASYLLFEPAFCAYLVELGRQDAHARRDEIEAFLFADAR